jgi:hypothetical protein
MKRANEGLGSELALRTSASAELRDNRARDGGRRIDQASCACSGRPDSSARRGIDELPREAQVKAGRDGCLRPEAVAPRAALAVRQVIEVKICVAKRNKVLDILRTEELGEEFEVNCCGLEMVSAKFERTHGEGLCEPATRL